MEHVLKGAVYVAQPYENEFDSLLAIYIAVYDPETGVVVKLAGHVVADEETGQLTTSFNENPQLPVDESSWISPGSPQAALKTPPVGGEYSARALFDAVGSAGSRGHEARTSFAVQSGAGLRVCLQRGPGERRRDAGGAARDAAGEPL